MEKMLKKAIFRDTKRTRLEVANILKYNQGSIDQILYRFKNKEYQKETTSISNKILMRFLFNVDDDVLEYFLNDDNFDNFIVKKD